MPVNLKTLYNKGFDITHFFKKLLKKQYYCTYVTLKIKNPSFQTDFFNKYNIMLILLNFQIISVMQHHRYVR